MDRLEIEWSDVEDLVDILAEGIANNIDGIKFIHGLSRGGLIPAVMLSHKLNIPMTEVPHTYGSWQVLIVDDIADSGHTLRHWDMNGYQTAVLHYKPKTSKTIPTIWSTQHETGEWIVYPWEQPQALTVQDYKLNGEYNDMEK